MKKIKLIIISGTVGSGKTTLSIALLSFLKKSLHVCYKSLTAFPFFTYLFYKLFAYLIYDNNLVKKHEKVNVHPSTLVRKRLKRSTKIMFLLTFLIELFSLFYVLLFRILLYCRNKNVIILDEGPINMGANYLEIFSSRSKYFFILLFEIINYLMQKYDVYLVFLDADDYILINRWVERGYPSETNLITIDHHLKYIRYMRLSKELFKRYFNVHELNASESIAKNADKLISILLKDDKN